MTTPNSEEKKRKDAQVALREAVQAELGAMLEAMRQVIRDEFAQVTQQQDLSVELGTIDTELPTIRTATDLRTMIQTELRTTIQAEIREPMHIVGELQYAIQQLEEKTRLLLLAANRRGEASKRPLFANTGDALEETAPLTTDASEEQKRYVANGKPRTGAPVPHLVGEYPRRPGEGHREY